MQLPTRIATGAFLLNSGWSKWDAAEERAKQLHGVARDAYPVFDNVDSTLFTKALSAGEMALGGALLLPIVPEWLAGAGLTAFSAGLLGLYARLPGMHRPGSIRPTEDGLALAKDSWMLAIGLSLLAGAVTKAPATMGKRRRKRQKAKTKAKADKS
jgi:hypothetical protein